MKKPIPFGKYYLLERINVGGMAEVFRAKAYGVEGFERLVAVKRILPNIAEDAEFITMFIDEAKIAVQLNHANIAQIFDLGVVDGSYFIALEHIHGRDLRAIFERCRARGEPMPVAQACFMVMKMCEGLDYAHNKRDQAGREMGLVHRDVSPQNVLVSFEGEVKIIDFGIAKAAGKVGKTQAGILKGKFGYMSPEQVRGLPIDRRSDIFSTGIVLYELLTNERLFVGESDFSTLEKVRNVEILPPSTYNRKIPDELERIVLKALAKDVEDRYQNSIDLHDELQAFVYTAGEFYSRKDLAAWMKKTFAKEIEEETAKLEQYRQLAPPEMRTPGVRTSGQQPAVAPPARRTQQGVPVPPPPGGAVAAPRRPSAAAAAAGAPPPPPRASGAKAAASPPKSKPQAAVKGAEGDLAWDDEEIETQIYDTPNGEPPEQNEGDTAVTSSPRKQAGTEAPQVQAAPPSAPTLLGANVAQGAAVAVPVPPGANLVAVPTGGGAPMPPFSVTERGHATAPPRPTITPQGSAPRGDPSAVVSIANQYQPIIEPALPSSAQDVEPGPRGPSKVWIALVAVLALALIGVVLFFTVLNKKKTGGGPAVAPAAAQVDAGKPVAMVDQDTGFDIITVPEGCTVKLDDRDIGPSPRKVRNLPAGGHVIEIMAPPGYRSRREQVTVEQGKAPTLNYRLDPSEVLAKIESEPPGAKVTLLSDGGRKELGPTPVQEKLDPSKRYEILFEKDTYVPVTKPAEFNGSTELKVAVVLEKATVAVGPGGHTPPGGGHTTPPGGGHTTPPGGGHTTPPGGGTTTPPGGGTTTPPGGGTTTPPGGGTTSSAMGKLSVGAKPACQIFIDGSDTGRSTPLRDFEIKAGAHTVTLVNNEYGIKEKFPVNVKAGETTKVIKDFSDKMGAAP
jgi:eukaryotic-like serine/threonine-protein kinase